MDRCHRWPWLTTDHRAAAVNSSTALTSVPGLSGVPDVPTNKAIVSSASLVSVEVEEARGLVSKEQSLSTDVNCKELTSRSDNEPIQLTFRFSNLNNSNSGAQTPPLTGNNADTVCDLTQWSALLWRGDLYLNVPDGIHIERSKEAFVTLLEFAEEELYCKSLIVCLAKNRPELKMLMRMFMFLGFVVLPMNHPNAPKDANDETIYMAYSI